jgi:hypothetical protein
MALLLSSVRYAPSLPDAQSAPGAWQWNVEKTEDFGVEGFMSPYVVVTRRSTGHRGSLEFQHQPRFYWRPKRLGRNDIRMRWAALLRNFRHSFHNTARPC